MNTLINIFINGEWDADHKDQTDKSPVVVINKGAHVQILADQYEQYIDDLEEKGYSYLCPEMYAHPQWNGEICYID
jgi:dienelactone hydrolase